MVDIRGAQDVNWTYIKYSVDVLCPGELFIETMIKGFYYELRGVTKIQKLQYFTSVKVK